MTDQILSTSIADEHEYVNLSGEGNLSFTLLRFFPTL